MHWRDMNTGTKVSAAGHGALIVWVLLGGVLFQSRETQFEFANVSVISEAEFADLREAAAPREEAATPDAAATPPPPRPTPPEPAPPEPAPPEPAPPEPAPPEPAPPEPVPPEPPPSPDPGSTVLENAAERAAPQEADIVAQEETPAPEENVQEAPVPEEAAQQEPSEEPEVVTEEVEPAAPEETTTAIVTEADTPAAGQGELAPERSIRPRQRPERLAAAEPQPEAPAEAAPEPAQQPEPDPPPQQEPDTSVEDAVAAAAADAVAEALAAAQTSETGGQGAAASGPPLTGGERDAFRLAVQRCWVIDPGSESSRISVTVAFSLDPSGRVTAGPTMIANSGGSDAAVRTAFEAARRAVVRCGASGFPLPPEKYEQWKEVEMTFDASGGRIR